MTCFGPGWPARILVLAGMIGLTACGAGPDRRAALADAPGKRMTAEEVRAALVGRPWRGRHGVYRMSPDGAYSYDSTETTLRWGPVPYAINADGTVIGKAGTWTFYRIGSAYRHHSSETGEFHLAAPLAP